MRALTAGEVSEYRATLVAKETACLSREDRITVDARLAKDLPRLGNRSLAAAARRLAAGLDASSVVRRMERAVAARRVTVRPAPDGMAWLTFLAPLPDAVAAHAAVGRLADAAGSGEGPDPQGCSLGQLMVDLGLDRIIGREPGEHVDVTVHLVMSPDSLLGGANDPAAVPGHGAIPAAYARSLVRAADRAWVRRLFPSPDRRQLVAMDSTRRCFDGSLRELLVLRDQTCRTPWCDAPIRAADHARPARAGGATDTTNGVGLCERCNYTKEAPGWRVRVVHTGLDPGDGQPHTIAITTPTGQTHDSVAPPILGWGADAPELSALERHFTLLLAS